MGKKILKILCGVLAVASFFGAFGAFTESVAAGLLFLVGSVLLFPPAWAPIRKSVGRQIWSGAFVIAAFVLLGTGSATLSRGDEAKAKELGFASATDYRRAKVLDLDPAGYAKHQQDLAAAEKKKQEEAKAAEEAKKLAEKVAEEKKSADCKADLLCWSDKHSFDAAVLCKAVIERMAKYDYEWTDGITTPMFKKVSWIDKKKGSVTYFGDEVKMQNGFGNFLRQRYACKFDPLTKSLIDVTIEAGRI